MAAVYFGIEGAKVRIAEDRASLSVVSRIVCSVEMLTCVPGMALSV